MSRANAPLLAIENLKLHIDSFDGTLEVLDGIDVTLAPGETAGVVGETGCGKSVLGKTVMRLMDEPPARVVEGAVRFKGDDLVRLSEREMRRIRGLEIAMIFQDPMTYLNPVFTVGQQIIDVIKAHERVAGSRRASPAERRRKAAELLARVHLPHPEGQLDAYPHQLSGGMRQRVLIAMALAGRPSLLIADEPTTALDVTIQAQILRLIDELVQGLGFAVVMISHDLGVVARVCRRILVMYAGTIVEDAPTDKLFEEPLHPYTQGLLRAIPHIEGQAEALEGIPGHIPNLIDPPRGCRFYERCPLRMDICQRVKPPLIEQGNGHRIACHHYPGPEGRAGHG